jgi:Flp pilus assembly protein TadG
MNNTKFKTVSKQKRRRSRLGNRKGAAVVEFAVCLPVIVLIMLGSIEAANMLFLRQALVQASYEGAKAAVKPDADNASVSLIANQVAEGRRLSGFTVETIPADVASVPQGQLVRVRASAPVDSNSFISGTVIRILNLDAEAVMVKE